MGTLGKYTTYVGGAATKAHTLLAKLFPNNPFAKNLEKGDEVQAQRDVTAIATAKLNVQGVGGLQPSDGKQLGDLGMFPTGVDLSFGQAPDMSSVKWTNPGDPANPYMPDVTSPPDLGTQGSDKSKDPLIAVGDLPNYASSDTSGADTRNPTNEAAAIYGNNAIGAAQEPGKSGGNV